MSFGHPGKPSESPGTFRKTSLVTVSTHFRGSNSVRFQVCFGGQPDFLGNTRPGSDGVGERRARGGGNVCVSTCREGAVRGDGVPDPAPRQSDGKVGTML